MKQITKEGVEEGVLILKNPRRTQIGFEEAEIVCVHGKFIEVSLLQEVLKDRKYLFQKLGAWTDLKKALPGVLEDG